MFDKLLAIISMALFGAFMLIILLWVEEAPALPFVLGITFMMGIYDFWREAFSSKPKDKSDGSLL